jgi:formylmethanofuran dehydrogenase subunit A
MATERVSTTSVTADAPIALYTNSPENTDLSTNYKKLIPGNTIGAMYLASGDIGYNEVDGTTIVEEEEASAAADAQGTKATQISTAPSLSDIQVISRDIVYDATGNPSVQIVFKIKNSSGQKLKGINARVELL